MIILYFIESRFSLKERILKESRVIELIRKYPNLHGDLSSWSGYYAISRDSEFGYRFMEEFQDKLHFSTDFARVPPNLPTILYFTKYKQDRLIPAEVCEKITLKNTKNCCNYNYGVNNISFTYRLKITNLNDKNYLFNND